MDRVEKFVRSRTKRYGRRLKAGRRLLPYFEDLDDLIQTVYLHLILMKSSSSQQVVGELQVADDFEDDQLYTAICCAYWRAADSLGGKHAKRWERNQPQEEPLDSEAVSRPERNLLDDAIDLTDMLMSLSDQERFVWTRSFEGDTLRTIAKSMGVSFQDVGRIRRRAVEKLSHALND